MYLLTKKAPEYIKWVGQHPDAIFTDTQYRKKLLLLLGDKFLEVRERLQVSSPIEIKDYRYLVGSGIMAHSGGRDEALLIIDMKNDEVWAFWIKDKVTSNGRGRTINLEKDFELRQIIDRWVKEL